MHQSSISCTARKILIDNITSYHHLLLYIVCFLIIKLEVRAEACVMCAHLCSLFVVPLHQNWDNQMATRCFCHIIVVLAKQEDNAHNTTPCQHAHSLHTQQITSRTRCAGCICAQLHRQPCAAMAALEKRTCTPTAPLGPFQGPLKS